MLAIFATVKNEAASILEWLAFHKLQGFELFVLGLDNCDDNTQELILNSVFNENCIIIDIRNRDQYRYKQPHFHMQAIPLLQDRKVEWAIGIDIDEYVYSPQGKDLSTILSAYSEPGVSVNWRVFGSSGLLSRPSENLVIETFTKHILDEVDLSEEKYGLVNTQWIDAGWFKTFVRPDQVIAYANVHYPITKKPFVREDHTKVITDKHSGKSRSRSSEVIRINHYFAQDRQHWNAKIARGRMSKAMNYQEQLYQFYCNVSEEDNYLKETWSQKVKAVLNNGN